MNPSSMLNLRDIELPDSVSWWPPALGWWLLLLVILLSIAALLWLVKYWKRPRMDKKARAEIERIYNDYLSHGDQQAYLQQISIVLRRIGMTYLPRKESAAVSGEAWYKQLNQLVKEKQLDKDCVETLAQLPYQKVIAIDEAGMNRLHHQLTAWASALAER